MNFGGAPGAQQGTITPDGGCPGKFFTSRRWTLDQGALTINDYENQPLAHLNFANGRFEGQATTGMPVTLSASSSRQTGNSWPNSSSIASPNPAMPIAPR